MAGSAPGHGGNAETLRRYWAEGPGAAKIQWGTPGDFDRCITEVDKYMTGRAKGYCNLLHHRALGYYPATHAKMSASSGERDVLILAWNMAPPRLELARHVRTEAGVRRYGKPIGAVISGTDKDPLTHLTLKDGGRSATLRRNRDGSIERRNPDKKTWRPASSAEQKLLSHAEKEHAKAVPKPPKRGADFVREGKKAAATRAAKQGDRDYPVVEGRVQLRTQSDKAIVHERRPGKFEIVTSGKRSPLKGQGIGTGYDSRGEALTALPAAARKHDAINAPRPRPSPAAAPTKSAKELRQEAYDRAAARQGKIFSAQDAAEDAADAALRNLATDAQVDHIVRLLHRRARNGEGGGFMVGPTVRDKIAKMSKRDASSYIDSLTSNY